MERAELIDVCSNLTDDCIICVGEQFYDVFGTPCTYVQRMRNNIVVGTRIEFNVYDVHTMSHTMSNTELHKHLLTLDQTLPVYAWHRKTILDEPRLYCVEICHGIKI